MNRQIITPLLAAAVAISAIPALAQEAAAPAAPAAAPAADAAPAAPAAPAVSDDEIKSVAMFLAAYPKLTDAPDGGPSKAERTLALLNALHLSFERYNAIAAAAKADQEVGIRIAAAEPDEASVTATVDATIPQAVAAKAAAPAAAEAAQAAANQAAQAAVAAEPPPVLPTSGDGAVITTLLSNVCLPLVRGGDVEKLAKAAGMKRDSKTQMWVLPLTQKTPYQVAIEVPGVNKTVCTMHVRYQIGADQPIMDSLNTWRFLSNPKLVGKRSEIGNYPDAQRVTTTWDNYDTQMEDGRMVGLAVVQINKKDGAAPSVNAAYDEADVRFQIRRAMPGAPGPSAGAAASPAG